ncbi:MAG: general secretion pathway protein GspB [Acidobacteriota bacterium]
MSYILDALRKADSERERGEVPGLHAQPLASSGEGPSAPVNQKLLLAVGVLTALLLALLAWLMWGREARQPAPPAEPPQLSAPPAPPAPPMAQALPPQPMTPPSAPLSVPSPLPSPTPSVYPPAVTQAELEPAVVTPPPKAAPSKAAESTAPAAAARKPQEDAKVYRLADLPESVRRDLPTLTIGGAMYSDTPANRMLIINNQVLHEGDKLSADLTLEEIKLKSAVFRFRAYRYLVNY